MSINKASNLVWIDLEMTGLNPDTDRIIEIATIVTDAHLNILAEGPVLAIHQKDIVLNAMDEWNTTQHGNSGLISRVRRSTISEADAEAQTLEFLSRFVDPKKVANLRQLHLPRSPLLVSQHAQARVILSLPQFRCEHG